MPKPKSDRHKEHSKQYNVRIPNDLLDAFNKACHARMVPPAVMVRTLMQGFVDVSSVGGPSGTAS